MTRVAIYARVSTKEQTTETQVAQLTAYCQARAWTDVAVFRDDGISGSGIIAPNSTGSASRMMAESSPLSSSRRWTGSVARSG